MSDEMITITVPLVSPCGIALELQEAAVRHYREANAYEEKGEHYAAELAHQRAYDCQSGAEAILAAHIGTGARGEA